LDEGRHILLGVVPDPVTYGLGQAAIRADQQSLALLTGANSGGKTTLLECLAYASILAHMGLPVPATQARIGKVDALHILAKAGGTQSAGALEQTLVELATVVSDPTPKLILADELEAITEPGAGARIIAGMLLAAESQPDTTMMLVTHLAPAILEASGRDDLRVDGIEASGLGDDLELLVDRTPKRNHLARSTPELIVKRLVEKSEGHAKALFADILGMFNQQD
jgi:dsDNA-specific endonuclease/ATPase MutS2